MYFTSFVNIEFYEPYDPGILPNDRRDDHPSLFFIFSFDDSPTTMDTICATPLKVVEITLTLKFVYEHSTINSFMRCLNEISVHEVPPGSISLFRSIPFSNFGRLLSLIFLDALALMRPKDVFGEKWTQ
jgi:hypothetical protein